MKPKTPRHHKRWILRLFEWGVLACVILILMGVFLRKVRYLQAEAERLNVQAMVENMRAAVLIAGILPAKQVLQRSLAIPGGNPVALLEAQTGLVPAGYMGELDEADQVRIATGSWYFDRPRQALIYRLRITDGFTSPLPGPARIRLCLREGAGGENGGLPLQLEACEPYRWQPVK